MRKMHRRRAIAVAATTAALAMMLSGCGALGSLMGGNDAPRDEETDQVTEDANIGIFELKVGDCMPESNASNGEMTDADVVPCSDPHTDEVFFEFALEDGDLPGDDEIQSEVEAQCVPAFTEFVGFDYYESALDLWWITPTEETWTQANDRIVQCVIFEPDPEDATASLEVTGTLEGAGR